MKNTFNFGLWNNLSGALVFVLSATIYLSTVEPTVSFWDCGEFLSCGAHLEICHPPGAPLVMLIHRIAALFAGSDPSRIALMINGSSAIASALTIMFLFWTITWFGRKLLAQSWESSTHQKILIIAAGYIGAMSYAFSDSFWFSAVEAEVYALSSLFTAIVFWSILKWEEAPEDTSGSWLMLIAYLFGLSLGVHLLNLLTIPAIVVLYYFKKNPLTWKVTLKALGVSAAILTGILYIIIPGVPKLFSWIELLAVNSLSLPYNSGFFIGMAIISIVVCLGLYFSYQRKLVWLYNGIIYTCLILIGFSTYTTAIIRSHDNLPIDMSDPEDPFALVNYVTREQYAKRPLFYGQSYASPIVGSKDRFSYERTQGKYTLYPLNPDYIYDKNTMMLFPRMASDRPGHDEAYKQWAHIKGKPYTKITADGQQQKVVLPTFGKNLTFFFNYQLGFMYFRYFLWNFVGRQNDIQGHGQVAHGNWISGISILDDARLGPQDKLPSPLKNNPGRNVYYFLPLLMGLLGLYYQYKSDKKNATVLGLLFFFTGIAIVIFLNEEPVTPRERDYVHVGSFYTFSVWIGLGVLALAHWTGRVFNRKLAATIAISASVSIPTLMAIENWDDHNRSGRFAALEYARNFLNSCEPDAILFTNADNDTYPLWYAQEVEGIRRDVQIILLPYLSATWYVNQLREPSYNKPGLRMKLTKDKFTGGKRTILPVVERIDSTVDLNAMLNFVGSDNQRAMVQLSDGSMSNYVPSRNLFLKFNENTNQYKQLNELPREDSLQLTIKDAYLRMDRLVLFDILASNNWERPVYFASVQEPSDLGIAQYLQLDGYAYKLVPYKKTQTDFLNIGLIDSCSLYEKFMHQFNFNTISTPDVYLDWTHMTVLNTLSLRNKFCQLAETLLHEGKKEKAIKVLDKIMAMLPDKRMPYDYHVARIAEIYIMAGEIKKGEVLLKELKEVTFANIDYYQSIIKSQESDYDLNISLYTLQEIMKIAQNHQLNGLINETSHYWNRIENALPPSM